VWLPPRKLHLHANLERYGIATTTAEHNKLAQQADAAFQEAVDITAAGTILDGYPQWKKALDMDCSQVLCIEHLLTDEQELEWLLQRHRRRNGWNRYCRILTALQLEPKFKQEALANQIAGGQKKGLSNLTTAAEMHVRRKLAERADACEAYIDYVKRSEMRPTPTFYTPWNEGRSRFIGLGLYLSGQSLNREMFSRTEE
jgi:hypothetical protein